jgi:transposase InsO family protein
VIAEACRHARRSEALAFARCRERIAHPARPQAARLAAARLQRDRPSLTGIRAPRRGGYCDPESQAFIESWFSKLKQRCIWREEFETLDEARNSIGADVDRYHHRPHPRLNYNPPRSLARNCA